MPRVPVVAVGRSMRAELMLDPLEPFLAEIAARFGAAAGIDPAEARAMIRDIPDGSGWSINCTRLARAKQKDPTEYARQISDKINSKIRQNGSTNTESSQKWVDL